MEIRSNRYTYIIAPLSEKLDRYEASRIEAEIKNESREVAIDLNYVKDCSIEFIETLKKLTNTKTIGIFNIPSDIFVLFNIMNVDKLVKLYVSELDFKSSQRQLINRQFKLVQT
jgi:hypothetical protein